MMAWEHWNPFVLPERYWVDLREYRIWLESRQQNLNWDWKWDWKWEGKEPRHRPCPRPPMRPILVILALVVLIMIFIIILIFIVFRPTKPRFTLKDAAVYTFDLSPSSIELPSSTLNLTLQATLSAHNPNDRIGIFYRSLNVYVSYRGQQLSRSVILPPSYQDHHDITVWSPYLYGIAVSVPPYLADALREELNSGAVMLKVVVVGDLKWKVWSWVFGTHHLHVNCRADISFAGGRIDRTQSCGVDI